MTYSFEEHIGRLNNVCEIKDNRIKELEATIENQAEQIKSQEEYIKESFRITVEHTAKLDVMILKLRKLCHEFAIVNEASSRNDELQDRLHMLSKEFKDEAK